jgi:16S rRNA (guanine966-N2)-methyltransferase
VGIEAVSRGASRAVFVEKNQAAVKVIRENLAALGLEHRTEVFTGKALPVLERSNAGIVFLDPPYEKETEYEAALSALAASASASKLVIAQHASRFELKPAYGTLKRHRILKQGDNSLSFYQS